MVREIIDAANHSGFTGDARWDNGRAKRGNISSVVNAQPSFFAVVHKATYAHLAFPGVRTAAARHAAQQQAARHAGQPHAAHEKKAAADAVPAASAAPHRAEGAAAAPAVSQGAAPAAPGNAPAQVPLQGLVSLKA